MSFLIRTLLIWLLVLAVPAQGAAAATMASGGPNHHGGREATQVRLLAAPAEHAHQDGGTTTAHEHRDQAAQADEDSSASASSATSAKVGNASKHKCSACASCCSVGAILSSVLAVPAPVFDPTLFSAVVPSVDTFAADSPDRPPRIVLA